MTDREHEPIYHDEVHDTMLFAQLARRIVDQSLANPTLTDQLVANTREGLVAFLIPAIGYGALLASVDAELANIALRQVMPDEIRDIAVASLTTWLKEEA